ncbi:hypothetical protein [Aequorivita echinoideorum]|uniref:Bulb-type lectin domain-containing protein n=1 Tax=Aequorivita echinoideorum TaxID=1549647 RepID=A0ABS5S172_9FLAO|nr:hypothetical protein [Aequorivita echinoideorum]MBT0606956.1 hypothetical protein [Aequorivita echinoideorum]
MLKHNTFFLKSIYFALFVLFLFACSKDDSITPDENPQGNSDTIPNDTIPTDTIPEPVSGIDFVKTYGGSGTDEAVSFVQTTDGSFVILGNTMSTDGDIVDKSTPDNDFWLLKISSTGNIIWSKTFGGTDNDNAARITKTSDGGFLLSGFTTSNDGDVDSNFGFQDYWIVKVSSEGNKVWTKNFGFSGSDQAFKAFETADGGYFITGFFDVSASGGAGNDLQRGANHGVGEYWGIRLNAEGETLWRRYFGGSNNDRSYDALQTADGGFLMTGTSESTDFDKTDPKGSYDYWAVRLSANGDLLWTKSYGGSEIDNSYGLTKTLDGNYIMVGDSRSNNQDVTSARGNADAWAVKFSDGGNMIWQKSFGGTQFETAHSIYQLSNGDLALTGNSRSEDGDLSKNYGGNDAWLFVIDSNGNLKSNEIIGGSGLDFLSEVLETSDQKLVAVGNTESNDFDIPQNRGLKDFLFVKLK